MKCPKCQKSDSEVADVRPEEILFIVSVGVPAGIHGEHTKGK